MSRKHIMLGSMAALMAMAAASFGSQSVYADPPRHMPTPPERPKSFDEQLAAKGLRTFIINGEEIIAHNEREAQKRYKARHKQ